MNYQIMRMEFIDLGVHKLILRGMSLGEPNIICNKCMEAIFIHGDVTCATKCLIT